MSKIYEVDFEKGRGQTKTISKLFDSIQHYRSEGKSIPEIYRAFCQSGLWKNSLSSFSNGYYQYRAKRRASVEGKELQHKHHLERGIFEESKSSSESLRAQSSSKKPTKKTAVSPELTLEEKRAISARIFQQKREGK